LTIHRQANKPAAVSNTTPPTCSGGNRLRSR